MVRSQKKPESGEPLNESAKPRKYRKRLTNFSRAGYNQAGKTTIKDKWGYTWTHVLTADEPEAKRRALFYKRQGKEFKIERNGTQFEVFVDFTSNTFEKGPGPWEDRKYNYNPRTRNVQEGTAWQHWKRPGAEREEIKKRESEEREKRIAERSADLKRVEELRKMGKGGHH